MTEFQLKVHQFVEWNREYKHCYPFIFEISKHLNVNDRTVCIAIKRIYPKYPDKYYVMTVENDLYAKFEPNMTMQDLADKCNVKYSVIVAHRTGLEKLGAKFKPNRNYTNYNYLPKIKNKKRAPIVKEPEQRLIGVRVTDGMYKGKLGYLDADLNVVLFINGVEKHVVIDSLDYKEV